VYDTRTGHQDMEAYGKWRGAFEEEVRMVLKRKSAWHWRSGFRRERLLAAGADMWLAPGKYVCVQISQRRR
jgi:hypothetical protein